MPRTLAESLIDQIFALLVSDEGSRLIQPDIANQGLDVDIIPLPQFEIPFGSLFMIRIYDEFGSPAFCIEIDIISFERDLARIRAKLKNYPEEISNLCDKYIREIQIGDYEKTDPQTVSTNNISQNKENLEKCLARLQELIAIHVTRTKEIDKENEVVEYSTIGVEFADKCLTNQDAGCAYLMASNGKSFENESSEIFYDVTRSATNILHGNWPIDNGSTYCGATIYKGYDEDFEDTKIIVSNLGDSRAMLLMQDDYGNQILVSLSQDADPNVERFQKEVETLGGEVKNNRVWARELNSGLATAAAFGKYHAQGVIHYPEIYEYSLKEIMKVFPGYSGKKLMLVSDGVTKVETGEKPAFYPVICFKLDCLGEYENTQEQTYTRVDPPNRIKIAPLTAQNLTSHTVKAIGQIDDITTISVNIENLLPGQKIYAQICDGHGRQGETISNALMKAANKHVSLARIPNHATRNDLERVINEKITGLVIPNTSVSSSRASTPSSDEILERLI